MTIKQFFGLYLLLFSIFLPSSILAQDYIFRKDGTSKKIHIVDIDTNGVFYKKWNFKNGTTLVARWINLDSVKYADGHIVTLSHDGQIIVREPIVPSSLTNSIKITPSEPQQNTFTPNSNAPTIAHSTTSETSEQLYQSSETVLSDTLPFNNSAQTQNKSSSKNIVDSYVGASYIFIKGAFSMKFEAGIQPITLSFSFRSVSNSSSSLFGYDITLECNKVHNITPNGILWFTSGIGIGYGHSSAEIKIGNSKTKNSNSYFAAHIHPKIGIGILAVGVLYGFDDFNFPSLKDGAFITLGLALPL